MKLLICMLIILNWIQPSILVAQQFTYAGSSPYGLKVSREDMSRQAQQVFFFDHDQDGDLDAFFAGIDYLDDQEPTEWDQIHYFLDMQENIGDRWNPAFGDRRDAFANFNFPLGYFFPAIGDINGDDKPDVVSFGEVNYYGGRTVMMAGSTTQGFDYFPASDFYLEEFLPESFYIPEVTDLDQDGDTDILMSGFDPAFAEEDGADIPNIYYARRHYVNDTIDWTGWHVQPYDLDPNPLIEILAAGDIDNDGDMDLLGPALLVPQDSNNHIYVRLNTPDDTLRSSFSSPMPSPFGLPTLHGDAPFLFPEVVDLDGDGDQDLFLFKGNVSDRTLEYYTNGLCTPVTTSLQAEICEGESYQVGNENFNQSGQFTVHLLASNRCDSIIELNLTVNLLPTAFRNVTICQGESYVIGNDIFSAPGAYTVYVPAANGCDSIINLTLEVLENIVTDVQATICFGNAYNVGNEFFATTGQYTVVLAAASGCDSTVALDLTVIEIDTAVTVSGETVTANFPLAAYQWYDCATGEAIAGATDQSFTPAESGSYSVRITSNGCTQTSGCVTVVIVSTSDPNLDRLIRIYPNPASTRLFLNNTSLHAVQYLAIWDASGKRIEHVEWSGQPYLDVSALPKGLYTIRIGMDNSVLTKRVVLQ